MDLLHELIELLQPFTGIGFSGLSKQNEYPSSICPATSVKNLSALLDRKFSHIYIVKFYSENNHWWKIGVSDDPNTRLTQLQAGNPYDLFFDFVNLVENPFAIESALHTLLKPLHRRGEWFMGYEQEHFALIESAKFLIYANHLDSMDNAAFSLNRIKQEQAKKHTEI